MKADQVKATDKPKDGFWIEKCVGNAAVIYSKDTTDRLTDLAGALLIMCISVYFTVGGYLFYREIVLSE
ncbi:hypothetical protein LMXM_25_2375 [Leishmania mexicana MHOM/GT/2001/U1103]|uniref:Uncharacterized protein n=1 Tax=Leishmania mexicana (strain MHOM/GT/2001/U1103) TaxID=929439 RepID=E9AXX2_LEIMU|nr:hypothetical protein LMXM_25_2375 [Leishmania mexicana MHOM/GT/2001/U1103]CBZ27815.1 hypothetical protein LMXM_25_2375 [Leishmania mexicana MHOM/GT/2001/U1103]